MTLTPEQLARQKIDRKLEKAGWINKAEFSGKCIDASGKWTHFTMLSPL